MRGSFAKLLVAAAIVPLASTVANGAEPPPPLDPQKRLDDSPRHQEWVELETASGQTVRAFVVFPEVSKPVPTVVVIHENRGLNDWARSLTDQVAEAGYVAIAPDMLTGKAPGGGGTADFESSDAARTAIYDLSAESVREALDAAVAYGRKLDATNDRVVVAGFCWGGGKTFDYAAHNDEIDAACVFYGTAPDEALLKEIDVPVYGFYGENDRRITGQVPRVAAKMKDLDATYEPEVYDGAGHGFMRSGETDEPGGANRKARNAAWERWLGLLSKLGDS